jgi:hypothetical protein
MIFACTEDCRAATNDIDLHFPKELSSKLPFDVDIRALRSLSATPQKEEPPFDIADEKIPFAQRLFDIFSWQAFISLNWPASPDGSPDTAKTIGDAEAPRMWERFVEVSNVYRAGGAEPKPWDEAVKDSWSTRAFWMAGMGLGKPVGDSGEFQQPVLDESLQAFTGPMIDQEGKWVRYQAAMNKVEFDYLVENRLYSLEGEAEYSSKHKISFPTNDGIARQGSMEIKLSWKQLDDRDDRSRFFVRNAKVVPLTGPTYSADFGLVGMHIAVRTQSSPTWIWATFEQVDNVSANDLEHDTKGRSRRPSFYNSDNPTQAINQLAPKNSNPVQQYDPATGKDTGPAVNTSWDESLTTEPTQATRVMPVPRATAELNGEVQAILGKQGSVFQYYELIGTQWPAVPSYPAFSNGVATQPDGRLLPSSPESILYKVPGKIVPLYLVNSTMETFFQNGNQPAGPLAADDRLPPGELADPNVVFSTESCVGCHFSAGACIGFKRDSHGHFLLDSKGYRVPIYGQNATRGLTGNADFSWLMQLRAQQAVYKKGPAEQVAKLDDALIPAPKTCPSQ